MGVMTSPTLASAGRMFFDILPWLGVLVGVVAVGAVAIYLVRRAMDTGSSMPDGFTLHDIRRMHAAGELSDEEFERAKAAVIGRVSAPPGEDAAAAADDAADGTGPAA